MLIVYRVTPKVASAATEQAVRQSFQRISDFTSSITLVALISGLVSLAIGLPSMTSSEEESSVLEELLAAQVACLLVVLVIAFAVEAVQMSAEILGSQAPATAWLGAPDLVAGVLHVGNGGPVRASPADPKHPRCMATRRRRRHPTRRGHRRPAAAVGPTRGR